MTRSSTSANHGTNAAYSATRISTPTAILKRRSAIGTHSRVEYCNEDVGNQ